jgi:NADPH:quinone reductase
MRCPIEEAAGFVVAYGTSHVALTHRARLQAGETLLVLGAAGGVGLTAVQIGRLMGARVVAVARGPEKLAVAQAAGADLLIDSEGTDLRAASRTWAASMSSMTRSASRPPRPPCARSGPRGGSW